MEIQLQELCSDKSCTASGRTSVINTPVRNSTCKQVADSSEKTDAEVYVVGWSPTHSIFSSSSSSSNARERRRKKTIEETTLLWERERNGRSKHSPDDDANTILSSPGNVECCSSSATDETSSPSRSKDGANILREPPQTRRPNESRTNKEYSHVAKSSDPKSQKIFGRSRSSLWDASLKSDTRRSITSSENVSYRDRIRDRFNSVKERAVESLSRPQSRSQSRLKSLMMKTLGTRFEDLLKKEEDDLCAAMKRHEDIKRLWVDAGQEDAHGSEYEESCRFFTGTLEEAAEREVPVTDEETPSNNNYETENENGKVLTSELLGIREDWEMCEFKRAELSDWKGEEEKKKNMIFIPSSRPVSLEEKLEPGLAPRYLEDEGLYAGKTISLSSRMKNKMEQRLLKSPDGKKWFGIDGDISRADPLISLRIRSQTENENDEKKAITFFKPALPADSKNRFMDLTGNVHYVLDIDISMIQFSHHPLFSREHVLAQRLKELYFKYKRRKEVNNLSRCIGRLDALRRMRDTVLTSMKDSSDDSLNFGYILQRYEDDIKEVRRIRNQTGRMDKELISRILMTWKDLKQMRDAQGYRNTDLKLLIKKKIAKDVIAEKKAWDNDIKKEAREIYEESKKQYEEELEDYEKKRRDWMRSTRKREERREVSEGADSAERSSDTECQEDSKSESDESYSEEPKPPKILDFSEIETQILDTFNKCFRQPGEPELEFTIGLMDEQDYNAHDNKEQSRRSAVKRQNIFLKLFYNGKEVCRSKSQPLSQKFTVLVSQRFAIRILEWPESLMIEIHEDSGSFAKNLLVPGIYLPFPSRFATVENSELQKHEFSSNIPVTYSHTGVGSGNTVIPYPDGSDYNNRVTYFFTSGTIVYRIGWAMNQGQILSLPESYWSSKWNHSSMVGAVPDGPLNIGKLKEWTEKSNLDPNDPQNSILFHFLQQAKDCESADISFFRLDPFQDEFDFCSLNDLANNPRLKLLNLRDSGEPEFRGIKMVPLGENQIHREVFRLYEKRISTPQQSQDVLSSDPLDGHRIWGKKYLEQVRQKILKECRLARQHKSFQDVVSEESVPDLGTLGLTFMKWLRPKRPLRPVRKERKRITPQNLSGQDIKIMVNVVRAFEVPVRKDMDSLSTIGNTDTFSLVNVRPFVELSFQGTKARTTAADGANPTWNQDLHIPIRVRNGDLSHASLQSVKDNLYLHLFDEIIVDLIDDEAQRETSIHQRFERHWLASMEIPFATLYFNSKIEGTFKLYSPPVLLGYEREAHRRQFSGSTAQEPLLPQRDATYISLFVTVQPPLNPPDLLQEKLESSETSNLENHLEGWQKEVTDLCPHRKVKSLVMNITGKTVCIIRFIKPLCPPRISAEEDTTPEMAARYVAMIPSIAGSTFFPDLFDIWLTSDQIIRLLSGDSEDHALLLCSYFLHLGLKAYVLLGSGIPHGAAAYVLVKESVNKNMSEYYVWDATSGQKYNINDSFCPLQKIYCLFNDQNIWANIQPEEMPRRTRFDLTKRADWFPAFGKNFSAPSGSVQPDTLEYRSTSRQAVETLQDKMEKRLRDSIMKWRKVRRTRWNRYCSGTLRKLLPKLEESVWNTKEGQTPDHVTELQHILASHKMCGFPINMPYTDMNAVVEAVKATGVHCNESDEVEFALSVYIHPYPNDVLSVWIYVASLIRRR